MRLKSNDTTHLKLGIYRQPSKLDLNIVTQSIETYGGKSVLLKHWTVVPDLR